MVAGGDPFLAKIDNALVSKWPEPIDMEHDIFVPGKVEKWQRELISALRTRGLYEFIRNKAPTLEDVALEFPDEDPNDIVLAFKSMMLDRQESLSPWSRTTCPR